MTDHANAATVSVRVTRQQLRDAGLNLEEYETLVNDNIEAIVNDTVVNILPDPDPLLQSLPGLHALAITLPKYDGNTLISDWLEDFDRYSTETARTSNENKLYDLISHLGPEPKQWFQLLPNDTKQDYDRLRTALKDKFSPTVQKILETRGAIYSMKQSLIQSFNEFAKSVQLKARSINLPEDEVKEICINGAHPNLKLHLSMAKPARMEALLKLPCVVSVVSTEEPIHQMFQVLNDKLDNLESRRDNREKRVTFRDRSSSRSPGRSPGRRPSWTSQLPRRATSSWQAPAPQAPSRQQGWPRQGQWQQRPQYQQNRGPRMQSYGRFRQPGPRFCGKCNRACSGGQMCPAFRQQCHRCGKLGHFKSVCFSTMYQPNGQQ